MLRFVCVLPVRVLSLHSHPRQAARCRRSFLCCQRVVATYQSIKVVVHRHKHLNVEHSNNKFRLLFKATTATRSTNVFFVAVNHIPQETTCFQSTRWTSEPQCPHCLKRFNQNQALRNHIDRLHNSNKTNKYACPTCHKLFSFKHNLTAHIRTVHNREKRFVCAHCGTRPAPVNFEFPVCLQSWQSGPVGGCHRFTHEIMLNASNVHMNRRVAV